MDAAARTALATIRRCAASGRFLLLPHFTRRMDERGIVWPDILAVLDQPAMVRADGSDEWGRPRWIVSGHAADAVRLGFVCVLGHNARGEVTLFWED